MSLKVGTTETTESENCIFILVYVLNNVSYCFEEQKLNLYCYTSFIHCLIL